MAGRHGELRTSFVGLMSHHGVSIEIAEESFQEPLTCAFSSYFQDL
jgi:hypothetical protein